MIKALYTDGGVLGRNPSPNGVTWAFCAVDENNEIVYEEAGTVLAPLGKLLTNNQSEMFAIIRALEYVGNDWSGVIYSDSELTLGRLFKDWALTNIPANAIKRLHKILDRSGVISGVLVQGHPTKKELSAGIGNKNGYPVSKWNVRADQLCKNEYKKWKDAQ